MKLVITSLAVVFSLSTCALALWKISKTYKYSNYPCRLILLGILFLGNVISPILKFFITLTNVSFTSHTFQCYAFVAINWAFILSILSLFAMSVIVFLIILSSTKQKKVNYIGRVLIYTIFALFGTFELLLLPLSGAKGDKPETIDNTVHYRNCIPANQTLRFIINVSDYCITLFAICVAVLILLEKIWKNKSEGRIGYYRISQTFLILSFLSFLASIRYTLSVILGIKLSESTSHWISTINGFLPGLNALTYLLIECRGPNRAKSFKIKNILSNKQTRILLIEYFRECGNVRMIEIVKEWEKTKLKGITQNSMPEIRRLDHREAMEYLEKCLGEHSAEFFFTEKWQDYYERHKKLGKVESFLEQAGEEKEHLETKF